MKIINLLKEGHGLRYSPTPLAGNKKEVLDIDRTALQASSRGFGKTAVILAGVALLFVGLYLAYNSFGPWGPRLAALRQSIIPSKRTQPPAPSQPSKPAAPTAEATPKPAATLPPAPPEVTASQLDLWYRADKSYPYAIVVASFQNEDSGVAYARRLRAAGHPATLSPTDLGDKGRWYRVVLGRYESGSQAREAVAKLKGTKPFGNAWTTRLPFAVEVGRESDMAQAEAARDALSAKGVSALLFPEATTPDHAVTFRLIAGAFPSKEQAKAFADKLRKTGVSSRVVTP